jgi:hypothetical protein
MHGAIPPLPNTSSWRGAQLRKGTGTTLPLPLAYSFQYFVLKYSQLIPFLKKKD